MRRKQRVSIPCALAGAALLFGCSTTIAPPGGRLEASKQMLTSEAVDRALAQVDWPNFHGRSVYVDIGSPAAEDERHYLSSAVTAAIAARGAKITPDLKSADYAVVVLGKAVGIDESQTFFGIPAMSSPLLPVGLPEIALYKASEQKGVAKLETVVSDRKRTGGVSREGPVESETWVRDRRILFFNKHTSNTPELPESD